MHVWAQNRSFLDMYCNNIIIIYLQGGLSVPLFVILLWIAAEMEKYQYLSEETDSIIIIQMDLFIVFCLSNSTLDGGCISSCNVVSDINQFDQDLVELFLTSKAAVLVTEDTIRETFFP